ncbi:MAG: hypothetical protein Q7J14_02380, partial [Candidatus Magasanikbacteria bacterium]|nr:hypothetical protein [Candidatus Magasanikbacteria bacterium]
NGDTICNQNIRIHDWHVWNYFNEILIDTAIIKGQDERTNFLTEWGSVDDHIFIQPNTGDEYIGIAFDNYDKFEKYFKEIFDNF